MTQPESRRSKFWSPGWLTAFGITLSIAALASSTPLLPPGSREVVMKLFASVCHQLPDRSFHVDGVQLAVGHRCFGVYWAMPIAALIFGVSRGFWPIHGKRGFLLLLLSAVPAGVDWFGDIVGLWTNTPTSRLITGSLFGLTAGYFLTRAITDMYRDRREAEKKIHVEM